MSSSALITLGRVLRCISSCKLVLKGIEVGLTVDEHDMSDIGYISDIETSLISAGSFLTTAQEHCQIFIQEKK